MHYLVLNKFHGSVFCSFGLISSLGLMPISVGRDHFASTQRFYERIGSRFQKQTRVQIPENRSELRGKETKGTQRIIFIKMQMKLNEKLKNVKFWNLLSVNCKPTNSQNSVIMNSGHLEENLPLNRIFSSAPLKSLFFLQIFKNVHVFLSDNCSMHCNFDFDPSFDHWQTPFKEKDPSLSHEHCWT